MAAISLTNKTRNILNISKSLPLYASTIISTNPFSTAFERAEGSNTVAKAEGSDDDGALREGAVSNAEAVKDEPVRAVETADMVKDTAKATVDGAWVASKESTHKLQHDEEKKQPNYDN